MTGHIETSQNKPSYASKSMRTTAAEQRLKQIKKTGKNLKTHNEEMTCEIKIYI